MLCEVFRPGFTVKERTGFIYNVSVNPFSTSTNKVKHVPGKNFNNNRLYRVIIYHNQNMLADFKIIKINKLNARL